MQIIEHSLLLASMIASIEYMRYSRAQSLYTQKKIANSIDFVNCIDKIHFVVVLRKKQIFSTAIFFAVFLIILINASKLRYTSLQVLYQIFTHQCVKIPCGWPSLANLALLPRRFEARDKNKEEQEHILH